MSPTNKHEMLKRDGIAIEALNGKNYAEWKETAAIILGLKKLWQFEEVKDKVGHAKTIDMKKPVDSKESWLEIMAMVDGNHRRILKDSNTGADACDILENLYDKVGGASTVVQLRELFQTKSNGGTVLK